MKKKRVSKDSTGKAFTLLGHIADGVDTLSELSARSDLPTSTAHRLLGILVRERVVLKTGRQYRLGPKLIELGEQAKSNFPIREVAHPHLESLAKRTSETVHLGTLDHKHIVYLDKISGNRGLQMASYVGLRTPAQNTAMGKALIADKPEPVWSNYFNEHEQRTEHSIKTLIQFKEELVWVRDNNHALDREENELGIRCVAVRVKTPPGVPPVAISLSGATVYIDAKRQRDLAPEVIKTARAIEQALISAEEGKSDKEK